MCWLLGYPWQVLAWMVPMTLLIGTIVNIEGANQQKEAAQRLSQEEIRRLAATAERERIGRDLHDLLGHTLSLITLKLELSRKLLDRDPALARQEIAEAEKVARHALAEVRSAVTGIRAADLAAELAAARGVARGARVQGAAGPARRAGTPAGAGGARGGDQHRAPRRCQPRRNRFRGRRKRAAHAHPRQRARRRRRARQRAVRDGRAG